MVTCATGFLVKGWPDFELVSWVLYSSWVGHCVRPMVAELMFWLVEIVD